MNNADGPADEFNRSWFVIVLIWIKPLGETTYIIVWVHINTFYESVGENLISKPNYHSFLCYSYVRCKHTT